MIYSETLDFLWSLASYAKLGPDGDVSCHFRLDRMRYLLQRLGDPHLKFAVAHVAGTKGKGSTAAMLAAIFSQVGIATGLYTSPHLHTMRERVRINDVPLAPDVFVTKAEEVKRALNGLEGITTFEALTAISFLAFADAGVTVAVIEAGIGGRLDATNVVSPFVSVITSISYDHTDVLGNSLEQIAKEKAGVIKRGVPVVCAPQQDDALAAISATAAEMEARLELLGRDWYYEAMSGALDPHCQRFCVFGSEHREKALVGGEYSLTLLGEHQVENAVLALVAAEKAPVSWGLRPEHLCRGLRSVSWPGRFEIIELEHEPTIVLDGAHNGDSMRKLRRAIERHTDFAKLHLILGASQGKDIAAMLSQWSGLPLELYACRSRHPRAMPGERVQEIASALEMPCQTFDSVADALWQALSCALPRDCICVTGSLFVVAEAREAIAERYGIVRLRGGETEVISVVNSLEDRS